MGKPTIVIGRVCVSDPQNPGVKTPKILEAFQKAIDQAPPPSSGDIQSYKLIELAVQYGGIAFVTTTQVTIEVRDEPLD